MIGLAYYDERYTQTNVPLHRSYVRTLVSSGTTGSYAYGSYNCSSSQRIAYCCGRMTASPVVLFDGPCSLCQKSVRFILRHERRPVLYFASLQSDTGKQLFEKHALPPETDAMILIEEGKAYTGSEAALHLCKYLNYPWRLFNSFRKLPSYLHQPVYRWIAGNRYRWFGKDDNCPLPDPEQAQRFLT